MVINSVNDNEKADLGNGKDSLWSETKQKHILLFTNITMQTPSFDDIQKILAPGNSLLKKYLTEEVYNEYKDVKTSSWVTLYDIIKSCLGHPTSKIGIYAGDAESYTTFSKLFTPIIEEFHAVDSDTKYQGQLDPITLDLHLDPESYVDMRMRMWANLMSRFPSSQSLEDRKEVEKEVSESLAKHFGGKYFSAADTDPELWAQWQKKWWGFPLKDEYLKDAWIITDFWPQGSWIWMNDPENPSVIVIINEEDHIRFTWFGRDMQEIYDKVAAIYNTLDKELHFAKDEKYGNLWSCPSNIGHMFKSWLRIKFPKVLAKYPIDELKSIAKEYGCEIRGQWGESSKSFDIMEVSNSRRFMSPQEAVLKWGALLNRLTDMEKAL